MGHARDTRYAARGPDDVLRLIAGQPLAWLVSPGGPDACFTPLPLRAVCDDAGRLTGLAGHLARRNPHLARLQRDPAALALFLGPQAYVSPSWLDDRTQAPTWNYAAAVVTLEVALHDTPQAVEAELEALSAQMEAGRPHAWSPREMGARQARLAAGVVALLGQVRAVQATFKLGQDEAPHDFAQILQGLAGAGEHALVGWMQDFASGTRQPGP